MAKCVLIIVGLLIGGLAFHPEQTKTTKSGKNLPPKIKSFLKSRHTVALCPFVRDHCSPEGSRVTLTMDAVDPDGETVQFDCKVSAGILSNCGPSMTWDLNNVPRREHAVIVTVRDGRGGEDTAQLAVVVVDCSSCHPPPPPCPTITISTPKGTTDISSLIFAVNTSGAERDKEPSFNWTASLGKIIKGQSSSEVIIDATGFEGKELTVEVTVGGFDPSCVITVSKRLLIKQN